MIFFYQKIDLLKYFLFPLDSRPTIQQKIVNSSVISLRLIGRCSCPLGRSPSTVATPNVGITAIAIDFDLRF
jgi:hypothetical protein